MKKGQTTEDGKTSSPECCSKGSEALGFDFPGTNCHAGHWRRESSAHADLSFSRVPLRLVSTSL